MLSNPPIAILAGLGAFAILISLVFTALARKRGEDVGQAKQEAKDIIDKIQVAVKAGDDSALQRLIEEHLHGKKP